MLVGTPIGNLGDLSPRARQTLADADLVCCEDTRRTRQLLSALEVPAPTLVALHAHNEASASARALAAAEAGATVAVVSDAGMPAISDPGTRLVAAAAAAGVTVEVVPGPSAVVVALAISGLAGERFCFEGFLPRKGRERADRLAALAVEPRTAVLYEAPHRVVRTLADLAAACGAERPAAAVRELTKLHEEVRRGSLGSLAAWAGAGEPRGEWVLVVGGAPPAAVDDATIVAALEEAGAQGLSGRRAVDDVTDRLGVARRRVYQLALAQRRRTDPDPGTGGDRSLR